MGASVRYLTADKRTGRLSYRRDFPQALRSSIPGNLRELKRSLGCADIGDPQCADRFSKAGKEYARLVALARRTKGDATNAVPIVDVPTIFDHLSSSMSDLLAGRYETELLAADSNVREGMVDDRHSKRQRYEWNLSNLDGFTSALSSDDLSADVAAFGDDASRLASSEGLRLDPAGREFRRLCRLLLIARLQAAQTIVERDEGSSAAMRYVPTVSLRQEPSEAPKRDGHSLDELIAAFTRDREVQGKWSSATQASYLPVFRLLRGILGQDKQIEAVSRDDGRAVLKALKFLPCNLGKLKALKGLTIGEAIDRGRELGLATIAPKTINDAYLSQAGTLFGWAVKEQWITGNPLGDFSVVDPVDPSDKRDAFTMPQLATLFAMEPWQHRDVIGGGRPVRFWAALLSLYHGLRRGEIMQLRTTDIEMRDGVPVMPIRGERLKTPSARRTMPLHPELQRMGFVTFVDRQREAGADLLFPGEGPNKRDQWGDGYSKWFQRLITPLGFDGTKLGFHSFRHNFQDRLRQAGLHGMGIAQVLAGRSSRGDTSSNYGIGFGTVDLADAIGKITYPNLDLSHLYE